MTAGWWRRRVAQPVADLLKQGVTPERIALSIAVGVAVGAFPVLGATTLLCAALAIVFRLNLVAVQLANWLSYPLQIALLLPLYRLGESLFRVQERLQLSPGALVDMFERDFWGAIVQLWDTTLRAMAAWGLLAAPAVALMYLILAPALRRTRLAKASAARC